MKKPQFSPEDISTILETASKCGGILIGGQAINCWALLLEQIDQEPWKNLRPYTSTDADFLCSEVEMMTIYKKLKEIGFMAEVFLPHNNEKKINTGALSITYPNTKPKKVLEVNLLRQLEGLSIQEIKETAKTIPIAGVDIQVLDPIRLLESKTISLNTLDQSDRQDAKHLEIMVLVLKRLLENGAYDNRENVISRIVSNAQHQLGLDTLKIHRIDILDAIPWDKWKDSKNPDLKEFAAQEHIIKETRNQKLNEVDELEKWLDSLNPKPPGEPPLNDPRQTEGPTPPRVCRQSRSRDRP